MLRLFLLFLFFVANSAYADWIYISKNQSGNSFYIDKSTIKKSGNYSKFWILLDLHNPYKDSIFSFKRQMEFDCVQRTTRGLYVIGFTNNLGKGQVVMDGKINSEPSPISPNSLESDYYKIVCN
jgi:hypothetical protein